MDNSVGFNAIGGAYEFAYNYIHRIDDRGMAIEAIRSPGRGVHHNWVNVTQFRALDTGFTYTQAILYQNRFQSYFEPAGAQGSNEHNIIYNEWIPANSVNDFYRDSGFQQHNHSVLFTSSVVSLEHNYETDAVTIYIPNGMRVWDNAEQAWRCFFDDDAGTIDTGLAEVYYVPPNAAIKARATIKLASNFGTTPPKLEIRGTMDRAYAGTNGSFSGDQPFRGYIASANFNAANKSTYQTVELEFPAKPWGRTVTVGVISVTTASDSWRGWWEKPIEVDYSILPAQQFIDTGINNFSSKIYTTDNDAIKKIRIAGGRLI
jgi:hypothetical protein